MDNVFLKDGFVIVVELFIFMKVDYIIECGDDGWIFVIFDKSFVV